MSVHKTAAGGWAVRWREPGGRNRQRTVGTKRDAVAFDAEVRRRQRVGALAQIDAGAETLDHYVAQTWAPTYAAELAPKTRSLYAYLYDTHIGPALGAVPLRELTPEQIARWQADRLRVGAGPVATHKALTLLGGILQRAAEAGRIQANPARVVRRARLPLREEVRPLAPAAIERVRAQLRHRDATLVSLLAYAGLRPQEAIGLRWRHLGERTLVIDAPKTRSRRAVRLLDPLRADLAQWRLASGRPGDQAPIIPRAGGGPWTGYASWRKRTWKTALERAGLPAARPYDLRHSFASLLLHEGRSVHYVARQLGHGAELTLRTYGHVIEELHDAPRIAAERAIRDARDDKSVRVSFASGLLGPDERASRGR